MRLSGQKQFNSNSSVPRSGRNNLIRFENTVFKLNARFERLLLVLNFFNSFTRRSVGRCVPSLGRWDKMKIQKQPIFAMRRTIGWIVFRFI